jgi:hypothetical protein
MNKHDRSIASYGYNIEISTNMSGAGGDLRGDLDQGKANEGLLPKAPEMAQPMPTLQAPVAATGGRSLSMYERPSRDPMLVGKPQPQTARPVPQPRPQPRPAPKPQPVQPSMGDVPQYAPVVPVPPVAPPVAEAMPAPVMPPQAGVAPMPPVPSPVQPNAQPQMAPTMPQSQGQAPMPPQDEMAPRTMNFAVPPSNPAFLNKVEKGMQI